MTLQAPLGSRLFEPLQRKPHAIFDHQDQSDEAKELRTAIEMIYDRTPRQRHEARLKNLYVDLKDTRTGWNQPCEISTSAPETWTQMSAVAGAYSNTAFRFTNSMVDGEKHDRLAEELEKWKEQSELPPYPTLDHWWQNQNV